MTNEEELKLVYTGSCINANFIKSILTDNGINCLIKNSLEESKHAGFASGSQENACRIFVNHELFDTADKLIQEYLSK